MQRKDFLLVALAPLPVLVIPLAGNITSPGNWKWTLSDFVVAWVMLAGAAFVYRLLAARLPAGFAYRAAAGLAVGTGLLLTWANLAVQVIGRENPGNLLYFLVILLALAGVAVSRFRPAGMANTAFATAGATLLVPVIAWIAWPADFSPGVAPVFLLNAIFAASGFLFRHAANRQPKAGGGTVDPR
jgi:hypothetical protein